VTNPKAVTPEAAEQQQLDDQAPDEEPIDGEVVAETSEEIIPLPDVVDDEEPGRAIALLPDQSDWSMLRKIATTVVATDFVPKQLRNNAPAVMACLLYGRERGLGPMKALQEISIVDGRPSESAALMAASIRSAGHKLWREEHRNDKGEMIAVTAHGERADGTRDSFTFTLEMAQRAGLLSKKNWTQYPEAMLWSRAVSALARALFSDVFLGAPYTGDELGADVVEEAAA
jgi:hypothetical protein